jgi:hypothetical protein
MAFHKRNDRLAALFVLLLVQPVSGCTFLANLRSQPDSEMTASEKGQSAEIRAVEPADSEIEAEKVSQLEEQNRLLQSRVSSLESQIAGLQVEKEVLKSQNSTFNSRLETALKSRDDAVREVVRTRSRIEGMASEAEAAAMFAEARVLVDRMVEDAFNDRALGDLEQARTYLELGREELDGGNSGGAAYLFDLVSSLYEGFKESDPRKVTIGVRDCFLHSSPSASSKKLNRLSQGEVVTGLETAESWIRVVTASGRKGWVLKKQVQ